jgi:enoyl-CoA hydratase/carnithine racemase
MTDSPIKTRREGGILEVTLDRPKANAIDLKTSRVMGEAFRDFRDDPELRVAILRAEGDKFFCPGWDLKAAAGSTASAAAAGWNWRSRATCCWPPRPRPSPCPRSARAPSPTPPR